jgi:signal transduction histidine kinase/ligand-binding sensor domain-containing protein
MGPDRSPLATLTLAATLLAASAPTPAAAPLADFTHATWTVNDGAPGDIWTLARTPAGTLWLGTGLGLYRFDGVRFDRYPLRAGQRLSSTNINALTVLPDGDIWLGLLAGGTVRLRDGRATAFTGGSSSPLGRVLHFASTRDGALWAAAGDGLARFADERWQRIGASWHCPEGSADYVLADRRGILWAAVAGQLVYLRPTEHACHATGLALSRQAVLAEDRAGRLWVSDDLRGTRPLPDLAAAADPASPPEPAPATRRLEPLVRAKQMLFAGDGSLWLTEGGVGVWRLPRPDAIPPGHGLQASDGMERFSHADGLASDVAVPLAEDADGDVWVGTNFGLDSFRRRRLHEAPALSAMQQRDGFSLAPLGDGVLAANHDRALALDPPRAPVAMPAARGGGKLLAAIRAADGALWRIEDGGVWRETGGRRQEISRGANIGSFDKVLAFAPDRADGAWLSVGGVGVYHASPSGIRREPRAEFGAGVPTAITVAADGTAWFGYDDHLVGLLGDAVRHYGREDGLEVGLSCAIYSGRAGLLVAGESGLARLDGRRFHTIAADRDDAFAHVTGLVEADDGDLWLNGGRGVLQLRAADVAALFAPGAPLNYRLLDWRDGLPGIALQAAPVSTAVRDGRGRLWFTTNRGVAWVDPSTLARNERAVPVEITQLRAGDRGFAPDPDLRLPEGTRTVQLRYTALSLAIGARTRFRYRLDGVDGDWQDAGTRREASYANLAPGPYRFRVIAANADGVWSGDGAALAFAITPAWWQSRAFTAACALAAIVLAWAVHRLRALAIAARVRLRLEGRMQERERIARELHDTLLQGFMSLILMFDSATSHIEEPATRRQVDHVLDRAEQVVEEGRDRVRELRGDGLAAAGALVDELTRVGQELITAPTRLRLTQTGTAHALAEPAADEIFQIAREALANAARHAGAAQIDLALVHTERGLRLHVRDDGVGIAIPILRLGRREGHYGLRGMRERAQRIGATLTLRGREPRGTSIELWIPARRAYASGSRTGLGARLRRWRAAVVARRAVD